MAFVAFLALAALLGGAQSQFPRDETAQECYGKVMDIFFVLDSSTSIYVNDYRLQQRFVRDVVNRLDVGATTTRVGMLTFSDDLTRPVMELSRGQSKNEILSSINEQTLPYRTGVTNTDLAIRYVRENTQFRQDITKVIVVVTDGGSRSPGSTAREAQLAREQGFYLFVVGVGQYLDEREWRNIASDPDDSFIYNITSFRYLDNVKRSLPSRACPLPPIIVGGVCNVEQEAEVMFIAASQGTRDAIRIIDNFVDRTVDDLAPLKVSYFMEVCNFAETVDLGEISTHCDRFANVGDSNPGDFSDLLVRARDLARRNVAARSPARQVAVLFIDPQSFRLDRFSLQQDARALQQFGVDVVVVDLGRSQSEEIQRLASARENYVWYQGGSSRRLERLVLDTTCDAINAAALGPFNPV